MKKLHLTAAVAFATLTPLVATAAPIQWTVGSGGNDHWYEYVNVSTTAPNAFAAAAASSYLGMQGYLATITSLAENNFVSWDAATGNLAWIGGSDAGNEGVWLWMNGPEAGQAFTFTNWATGEPNNAGIGESYVHTNNGSFGKWNDHGAPQYPLQVNGYVIEYSATVPEPAGFALLLGGLTLLGLRRKAA